MALNVQCPPHIHDIVSRLIAGLAKDQSVPREKIPEDDCQLLDDWACSVFKNEECMILSVEGCNSCCADGISSSLAHTTCGDMCAKVCGDEPCH